MRTTLSFALKFFYFLPQLSSLTVPHISFSIFFLILSPSHLLPQILVLFMPLCPSPSVLSTTATTTASSLSLAARGFLSLPCCWGELCSSSSCCRKVLTAPKPFLSSVSSLFGTGDLGSALLSATTTTVVSPPSHTCLLVFRSQCHGVTLLFS